MSLPHYEYVIIGQGIAGSCVAWELWRRRKSFLLLDAGETATTSRVAAGLITPVTGQRLVPSWRFQPSWYETAREQLIKIWRSCSALLSVS